MDNSKKLTVDEIKECEKKILETFADFCEHNALAYYLTFGTLLGAVRHNGFIPWDDDIDVAMPRPDYNRLRELLSKTDGFITETIRLNTPYSKDFQYPISKVVDTSTFVQEPSMKKKYTTSLWIDVFPIDGLPSNDIKAERFFEKIGRMRKYYFYTIERKYSGNSFIGKIKYNSVKALLTFPYELKKQQQVIDEKAQKYSFDKAVQVGIVIDADAQTSKMPVSDLEQIKVIFEGREYTTFKNYDAFLRRVFHGDYMQLPPEKDRVYKHGFDAYRL